MKMFPCESEFADYLESQNKTWIYQPKRFRLKYTTYRADFYCPEDNTYYEVVGTRQAISAIKQKVQEFIKTYPDVKFKIVKPNGENYYRYGITKLKKFKEPIEFIPYSKSSCKKCIEDCKQNKYAEVLYCPQYFPKPKEHKQ